ncbi:hypothetical protein ACFLT8_02545 [Chloroflexota bacterium]
MAYVSCVAGTKIREEYLTTVVATSFTKLEIIDKLNGKDLYD